MQNKDMHTMKRKLDSSQRRYF